MLHVGVVSTDLRGEIGDDGGSGESEQSAGRDKGRRGGQRDGLM
jgi:hypothetical protein